WDARSHVLVQSGNDILRLGLDGTRISTDLGLPAGAHATSAYLSDQSPDRRVTVLRVAADRPLSDLFNGFGVRSLIDDSVSEVRPPRAYAIGWIGGHEKLMFPWETVSARRGAVPRLRARWLALCHRRRGSGEMNPVRPSGRCWIRTNDLTDVNRAH